MLAAAILVSGYITISFISAAQDHLEFEEIPLAAASSASAASCVNRAPAFLAPQAPKATSRLSLGTPQQAPRMILAETEAIATTLSEVACCLAVEADAGNKHLGVP